MKQVTLVASLVMACVIAQATTISWGTGTNALDTKFSGGTAYLIYNNDTSSVFTYGEDLSTAKEFSPSKFGDTVVAQATIGSDGKISQTSNVVPSDIGASGNGMKPFYMVVISSDGKSLSAMESTQNLNISTSSMTATFNRSASGFTGNYTAAIPEPTAIALIALGLAAFGLKRKVA